MPFLMRVELPDVPGSLGRVATAIGEAGGDIEAIEIVEHRSDGTAVDDVLLEMAPGAMPDSVVSACNALDGVRVLWISRYAAGGNLFLDLEVVEELTRHGAEALDRLVGMLPVTFRVDWAARVRRTPDGREVVQATEAAPAAIAWAELTRPRDAAGARRRDALLRSATDRGRDRGARPHRRTGVPRLRAGPARPPRSRWRSRSRGPEPEARRPADSVDRGPRSGSARWPGRPRAG